ncbi:MULTISPECIES: RluA family pseudouridine synthase [unclassified Polaromonas]|jgi:23S rRNA pseudouridine1911/1915/1917 synthase|uniref:RluA family pseudouridine synthase n=1 Tax=unclassified Polaromonas TaxID=2638319 RepID=UPI000F080AAD|nr:MULTISPECIES: RluA family pseudouridine synthase [unclassified Polaromonas]AYQ30606.1 RluA family pseudouridine synthase [Polaromonas sp. SP1]QGJ19129.1 RluA family pseudouridine synthase [Polaromonas sp. Pch-P]
MTDSEQSKLIISAATTPESVPDEVQEEGDTAAEMELRRVTVPADSHGSRLDRTLAAIVPEFSRTYLQQLIEAGVVTLGGVSVTKASAKVRVGDELVIELRPTPQSQAFKPEAMTLDIVFEDAYLMVINKPAGLVVHPAPGNWSGTLLNGLLAYDSQAAFLPRAGIVHRLDKDTSGLMVVARQRVVMDQLVGLIAARSVSREYVALAHGAWQGAGTRQVDAPIGRDPRNRLRMAVVDLDRNAGKTASTVVSLIQSAGPYCLVRCKLHTGRTHQIRVHMAFLGHPLVSDEMYGGALAAGLGRQGLHACRLAFEHPFTGQAMEFKSDPPADLQAAIAGLGLIYNQIS